MADHLVEVDRLAAIARSPRTARPPRSRRAAAGSPIRTSLASAALGVVDQPGQGRRSRPSPPRRSAGPSPAAALAAVVLRPVELSEQAGDAGRVAGPRRAARSPPARSAPRRAARSPPAPSPRPRRRWRRSCRSPPRRSRRRRPRRSPSRRRTISRWSAFRVGRASITRAPRSARPAGVGPCARIRSAAASASRSSSQIRWVVKRAPLALSRDLDHRLGGEEGVGELLDLGGRGAAGQRVGDRLDRVAAVEVGGAAP